MLISVALPARTRPIFKEHGDKFREVVNMFTVSDKDMEMLESLGLWFVITQPTSLGLESGLKMAEVLDNMLNQSYNNFGKYVREFKHPLISMLSALVGLLMLCKKYPDSLILVD